MARQAQLQDMLLQVPANVCTQHGKPVTDSRLLLKGAAHEWNLPGLPCLIVLKPSANLATGFQGLLIVCVMW